MLPPGCLSFMYHTDSSPIHIRPPCFSAHFMPAAFLHLAPKAGQRAIARCQNRLAGMPLNTSATRVAETLRLVQSSSASGLTCCPALSFSNHHLHTESSETTCERMG